MVLRRPTRHGVTDRLQPSLPILMGTNLASSTKSASHTKRLEQLLVFCRQGSRSSKVPVWKSKTKQAYTGGYRSFNLNLNCRRLHHRIHAAPAAARATDGDTRRARRPNVLCRVPQTRVQRPWRPTTSRVKPSRQTRPSAAMCERDENYVPLNDG